MAAASLLVGTASGPNKPAAPPPPPTPTPTPPSRTRGAYDVTFGGDANGTGMAVVNAKDVKISGTLKLASGGSAAFSATVPLDSSGYRFKGGGTLDGKAANVTGRIDPDDTFAPKSCRLAATFNTPTGAIGRLAGAHR